MGWKRPLTSSSPTITRTPPHLLNHVPKCHIHAVFEPLQGRFVTSVRIYTGLCQLWKKPGIVPFFGSVPLAAGRCWSCQERPSLAGCSPSETQLCDGSVRFGGTWVAAHYCDQPAL